MGNKGDLSDFFAARWAGLSLPLFSGFIENGTKKKIFVEWQLSG